MLNIAISQLNLRAMIARFLGHVLPFFEKTQPKARSSAAQTCAGIPPVVSAPIAQNKPSAFIINQQEIPPSPETPLEWFKALPRDMSLVIYIDQPTAQIMELLAVSRRQAADLFRVPMYAGKGTRWQPSGQFRMRRMEFESARIFQQQEDALGELEELLSARWYSSTELTNLDQSVLRAFEAACQPEPGFGEGAPPAGFPVGANAMTHLRELLNSRHIVSAEAARIDAALISAFQKIGVALPSQAPRQASPLSGGSRATA